MPTITFIEQRYNKNIGVKINIILTLNKYNLLYS